MFGCYFGLAVAYVLGKPKTQPQMGTVPDIFAFIGTVFLWAYWPSFVAGGVEADSVGQQRAIVNTILSLASSTMTTFWVSGTLNQKYVFRP
jgi:ammonia channel protein AmtB